MKLYTYLSIAIALLLILISITVFLIRPGSDTVESPAPAYTYFPPSTSLDLTELKPFDTLLNSPPTPAFKKVLDTVHLDVYAIYPCNLNNKPEDVVLFTAKYKIDQAGNFDDTVAAVRAWEPYILEDIGQFILPIATVTERKSLLSFVDVPVTTDEVQSTLFRQAKVTIGGQETFVHYGWLLNYVLFSSSKECLEGVMSSVYPAH
jgi:hypothetical protein